VELRKKIEKVGGSGKIRGNIKDKENCAPERHWLNWIIFEGDY
jgi:hypothetical protein